MKLLFTLLALITLASAPTSAGETDPTLLITRAVATDTPNGTLVRIDAVFPWNALLQSGYPIRLVVWRAVGRPDFVRFDLAGGARSGSDSAVLDGLTTSEVLLFAGAGRPDPAHVLTHVEAGRLESVLGAGFAGVPLGAQLFVDDHGTPFVSNPISVTRGLP